MRSVMLAFFILSGLVSISGLGQSSGIRGYIKASDDADLSFATIYVKQLGTGTAANADGFYELALPSGTYDLVFQHLGYETQEKQITITDRFIELTIVMNAQAIMLQNVIVKSGKEDPAYTIMRKAIAKAKYHTQQVDSFSAQVYIKGAGKLKDYPWYAKKALEKEGIDKDRVFISESVSKIQYKRPNTFSEKVISIRSDGKDNNTSPNGFIFGSFYQPIIAETVSPLSPAAFSYYRFEYQGTFKDRNYEVSQIKVTPRSRGDNVVEGTIFIVEDWWSIHSLDVVTTKLGIRIGIKQTYAPVEDKAWMPVTQSFDINGRFFGFEFDYKYIASVSDYKIQLNPDLIVPDMEVIDDKLERERAKVIEEKYGEKNQQLQQRLASGKEISNKELRQIVKEYEKQELKKEKEPDVVSNTSFAIDSGAYKKDSAYWALIRPIPLSQDEVKGYKVTDSLAVEEQKKAEGDTVKRAKNNKKGFQPWDLLLGDSYKISKHSRFAIDAPQSNFNTVEGYNLIYRLNFGTIVQDTNRTRLNIIPTFRYAFEREKASGTLAFRLRNKKFRFDLEGGRYVKQFNHDEPILPVVNTFTTLLLEENLMKIYERDFIDLRFRRYLSRKFFFTTQLTWAKRRSLENTSNYKWVDRDKIEGYTSNTPFNLESGEIIFPEHTALVGSIGISARPWLKYRIRNNVKQEIESSTPTLTLDYRKGFNNLLNSTIDFDQLEAGVKHEFRVGVRGRVHLAMRAGLFLNRDSLGFMDYQHFLGNRTPFVTTDPVGSYRIMDYYLYSTSDKYFSANVHYQFRKFLVTSITKVRMIGIRENIFVNYLATPTSGNYTELGYTIDGILRIFRLEVAAGFREGQYLNHGFRIGIATNIAIRFSDN